jgi:site-specific recombinase XerD
VKLGTLQIRTDKANAGRTIKLPPSHITFFKEVTKDKLPGAPMFTRADGKPWTKDDWKWVVKDAAQAAKLPATTVLYTLRHAAITDLVVAGADPLTVSRISGTSLVMIQKAYGHLTAAAAESALTALAM